MQTERAMTLTLNGRTYQVTVGDLTASPVPVTVNGRTYHVTLDETTGAPATVQTAPQEAEETTDSAPTPSPPATSRPRHSNGNGHRPEGDGSTTYVRAPMPGHISNLTVQPGQQVETGELLCALEAMKMKNPIRAPRSGTLKEIDVQDGQAVAHGDLLFALE